MTRCVIEDCDKPGKYTRGMCPMHYRRWRVRTPAGERRTYKRRTPRERLERAKWNVVESGCWEWVGSRNQKGYGLITIHNKTTKAHRLAYQTWVGPIPEGLLIRHKCDNPPCINPEHLEPGTIQDNAQDMVERGRSVRGRTRALSGEQHRQSKLTEADVIRIRDLWSARTHTLKELSELFGVSITTIHNAATRKTWGHVR